MAIAAAVDMTHTVQSNNGTDTVTYDAEVRASVDSNAASVAMDSNAASGSLDSADSSDSSGSGSLDSLVGVAAGALGNTVGVLGDALTNDPLGNTAAAMQLCDEAISAAMGSAVDEFAFNATGNLSLGATGGTMCFGATSNTMAGTMARTFGQTLGATGDIPPIEPGAELHSDSDQPTTPRPQGAFALLQGAIGDEDDDDHDESREPLSPTLMSICNPTSPTWSPSKKDMMNSSLGDSPSIIFMESNHFTPCKPMARPVSPSPVTPVAPVEIRKQEKKERPIRCGEPEALSARGRERHQQEMAALGIPVDGSRSARGRRPNGRGVRNIAVAGGA